MEQTVVTMLKELSGKANDTELKAALAPRDRRLQAKQLAERITA